MPAVAKGENAKAKPKTPALKAPPAKASAAKPPAKLTAARGVGLSPIAALNAAGAVIAAGLFLVLFTGDRAAAGVGAVETSIDSRLAAAGFRVDAIHLTGASPQAKDKILAAAGVQVGQPILDVDLDAVRANVEGSGWAKSAKVVRLLPGALVISVVESRQMAVWQHAGKTEVIDQNGEVLKGADPGSFPGLPLIVGAGAEEAAADILPLVSARPRLTQRLEALVRVDRRRWDLRLKDGALIQLPAVGEESALIQLDQLDGRSRLLELGFARVDLRDPEMVAVRPKSAPVNLTVASAG